MSSLYAAQRTVPAPSTRPASGVTAGSGTAPSAIVTLSQAGLDAASLAASTTPPLTTALRFHDRAAPLFDAIRTGAALPASADPLPDDIDHHFTLDIVTAGGTKVGLTLASRGDELLVRMHADAALTDAERTALGDLAQGYQDAIDGLAAQPPRVRLAGLTNVDTGVLASIDLDAQVTLPTVPPATQALAFHRDAQQRSVALDGPAGKAEVSVKTDDLAALGTRQQQDKAIAGYLRQFDQAAARGHADGDLMGMFKDAFADLSRTATRDDPAASGASAGRSWSPTREDRVVLTGLADFTASVTATTQHINPVRRDEVDGFAYQVAQHTQLAGATRDARSIAQTQESHLTAQYHEALQPGATLALDYGSETQNYKYHQIDDSASSAVQLQYRDGRLRQATLRQSASQSERITEFVLGKLKSDRTIPAAQQLMRDLVATLQPYRAEDGRAGGDVSPEVREERRLRALDALGDELGLLGAAGELGARDGRLRLPTLD
ncbi:hypothetical protein IP92_04062 [Pseudoduganella flava]|nr:hypothetical protein IP92_04062 [Pseudoduganella flava]